MFPEATGGHEAMPPLVVVVGVAQEQADEDRLVAVEKAVVRVVQEGDLHDLGPQEDADRHAPPETARRLGAGAVLGAEQVVERRHQHENPRHQRRAGVPEVVQAGQRDQGHRPFAPAGEKRRGGEKHRAVLKIAGGEVGPERARITGGVRCAEQKLIAVNHGKQPGGHRQQAQPVADGRMQPARSGRGRQAGGAVEPGRRWRQVERAGMFQGGHQRGDS